MFYLAETFRTSGPGENCSMEARGGAGLYRSFVTKGRCLNIKRLLLIKENQITQVKGFSAFLCMGRYRNLGSLRQFLSHAPQLPGASASILCSHILSFRSSGLTVGSGYSLMAATWQVFLSEFPQGSPTHHQWWLQSLMTITFFVYQFGKKYSIY